MNPELDGLNFEELSLDDIGAAAVFLDRVFLASVAKTLNQQGIETFQSAMTAEALGNRARAGNKFFACKSDNEIVGLGEIRDQNHLSLLFVEPQMQRMGIGRQLFMHLIDGLMANSITVNAALNSVDAYASIGFVATSAITEVQGIRSQAMVYRR